LLRPPTPTPAKYLPSLDESQNNGMAVSNYIDNKYEYMQASDHQHSDDPKVIIATTMTKR
jgi:hypothetical protein